MKEIKFELEDIQKAAIEFVDSIGDDSVFLFEGEMGAGKTTFIAEVCRILGALDDFGSPTFSIVNEYLDKTGNPIYHFDLYRVDSPQEIIDMGAREYFDSGYLCFVEWPDRLGALAPDNARYISLKVNPDQSRSLFF